MKLSQRQIIIIGGVALLLIVVVVAIFLNLRQGQGAAVIVTVWGFEKEDVFKPLIQSYNQSRPNVQIAYRQIPQKNYESYLLNALAAGQGPDIFPIHNRAIPKNKDKMAAADPSQLNIGQLQELFPEVIQQDFSLGASSAISNRKIYALPLYLDTLVLLYNKDLFDQASIVAPPKTWDEFQGMVPRLRSMSANGQIIKAAAALGGSQKTIGTAVDILNALMLQNGATMANPDLRRAAFASGQSDAPGPQAFNFYLQFANPRSNYYTWNDNQPDYLQSFSSGNAAMIFDYYSAAADLQKRNPFLNIGLAALPQPAATAAALNYADYWGLAVSKQSRAKTWAWDFIIAITTQPEISRLYLASTNRPPALRSLIAENLNSPVLAIPSKQALTARSWYEADEEKINQIFNNAITGVLNGQFDSGQALQQAQDQVSQLMGQGF